MPAKLGAGGVEEVMPLELTPDEPAALQRSAGAVRELAQVMGI